MIRRYISSFLQLEDELDANGKVDPKKTNEIRNKELEYEKIKLIDKEIQELADKIKDKEFELNDEYNVVDKMNSDLSVMDNQINESEWRVYQGSSEEILFNFLKNKLIKDI